MDEDPDAMTGVGRRVGEALTAHPRVVLLLVLVATVTVGAGAAVNEFESAGIGEFDVDDPATDALEEMRATYDGEDRLLTQVVTRDRGGDVLTRDALIAGLDWQRAALEDPDVAPTLAGEPAIRGVENVVATAAVAEDRAAAGEASVEEDPPTVAEQRAALESRTADEVEALLETVAEPDAASARELAGFLPTDWSPGTTSGEARLTVVTHADPDEQASLDAQVRVQELAEASLADGFAFGPGITDATSSRAIGDSFAVITPVALLAILGLLWVVYRDPVDVLIALVGIATVLVWLAGLIGWLGLPTSQLTIAVPFLLVGLSIDYGLHVVLRYREAGRGSLEAYGVLDDPRRAMAAALASVLLALAAATFTTGVGFLSNVVSPLPSVRTFAVMSGVGIFATFLVFATLVPALKLEVDRWRDPSTPRPGVGGGRFEALLRGVARLASRAPAAIVAVALILAVLGGVGATGLETGFNEADFLPQDAPDWAKALPGPLAAGTYTIADDADYLAETFAERGERGTAYVLVEGSITDPEALRAMDDLRGGPAIVDGPDGAASVTSPVTLIREAALADDGFAAIVDERDGDGDGLPDEDLASVYDALFEVDPEGAAAVLHRTDDGGYASMRLVVDVRGNADAQSVAGDVADLAGAVEAAGPVEAVATGERVTGGIVQDALLETLLEAFAVTLVVILVALVVGARLRFDSAILGAMVLVPVVVALSWLLGGMVA
ncbi:MAG: efflux RND transporter permease subunit, partial [Halobacteriales archaeon]